MKKRGSLIVILLIVVFASLVSSMSINVSSPEEGKYYDTRSINVNVDFGESVDWWVYLNGALNWSYRSSSINNPLTAEEGTNTIRILASNISNSSISVENTITFYVDTLYPNITSQTPENNSQKYKGNITFSVGYTEANLNYTKLYWKSQSDSSYKENSTECASGTCSKIIDFSSYSYWENISYYFSLTDKTSKYTNSSVYTFKIVPCITSWNCTEWSACSRSTQTRTCTKICENGTDMPSVSQGCTCNPSWNCDSWSSCSESTQTRTCTDTTGCEANRDESQSCSPETTTQTTNTQENTNSQNINYFLSSSQIGNGSLRTLKLVGDKISFKIKNESHSLELKKIYSDKVSIKISSVEQYANLTLNDVKKFDLTADGYYDISVILKRLNSTEADILLNTTNEKVPETTATTNPSNSLTASAEITGDALTETANKTEFVEGSITGGFLGAFENMKKTPPYLLIAFSLIILGLLSITISKLIRKKKRRKKGYYK